MSTIQAISIWAIPVLFAITLHEVAHGWVAKQFGDPTAASLGRLSLNPLKHIDPVGTVIVPMILIFSTGYAFGWAKPVPVNFNLLRSPKKDMIWVAAAGPFANLLMAVFWSIVVKIFISSAQAGEVYGIFLVLAGLAGIFINLVLMILNLIPMPPLDGGRILSGLTSDNISKILHKIEPYGMIILLCLLIFGGMGIYLSIYSFKILSTLLPAMGVEVNEFAPFLYELLRKGNE